MNDNPSPFFGTTGVINNVPSDGYTEDFTRIIGAPLAVCGGTVTYRMVPGHIPTAQTGLEFLQVSPTEDERGPYGGWRLLYDCEPS